MKLSFRSLVGVLLLGALGLALYAWLGPQQRGQTRYFENQTYHFQTLRAFNDIPAGGADTGEILEAIRGIRSGDAQSWYQGWNDAGERVLKLARAARDPESRGGALMRAHNYFRTAQFLLPPDDPKRPAAFTRDNEAFYEGLQILKVPHEVLKVPYGDHSLKAVYYPGPVGSEKLPLIVFFGGYDSTLEELYFMLVHASNKRGYAVLTFEGPGQGSALRDQHLPFTHEWERPTAAVLDAFLASHKQPPKIILVGMSMGGFLAPRAAAFDHRFDGVVAFDVFYDMSETARRYAPPVVFWLEARGLGSLVDAMIGVKAALNPDFRWALANGQWVMGTRTPLDTVRAFDKYTLADVAPRVKSDVLILAGERDHFVPLTQVERMRKNLTGARSVTVRVFDQASGGAEHCQLGAITLWHQAFFDWLRERFPDTSTPTHL
jgi:alpha-beta hydrolase superfamily lysophospholipase